MILLYILLGVSTLVIAVLIFLFLLPVIQICGYSMFPTMTDGEFHLGRRVFRKTKCKVGEIYVFKPPYASDGERYVVKRLSSIEIPRSGNPKYYFLGDNADDSYDSRYYGFVDCKNVVAHIKLRKEVLENGVQED